MGLLNRPLLRSRLVPLTVALFVAIWLALPALQAAATPPDTSPIQGAATARQDPPGSCPARSDPITFPALVGIQNGILLIADPGGQTSGRINTDGTADLTGPGESYHLLSSQGTTLTLTEVNGGCNFLTTILLQQPLPPLAGGPFVPQATAAVTSAPTTRASVAAPTVVVAPGATSSAEGGGRSLTWLWIALGGIGVVAAGGGALVLRCRCRAARRRTGTGIALTRAGDCSEERRRVERARQKAQAIWDLPELQGALGSPPASLTDAMHELDDALEDLADCLGEDLPTRPYGPPVVRTQDLLGHFGFARLVFPGIGDPYGFVEAPFTGAAPPVPPDDAPRGPVPPEEVPPDPVPPKPPPDEGEIG